MASCGQAQQPSDNTISAEGIGVIKLGMEPTSLPDFCDGLYDRIEVIVEEDLWDTYEYRRAFSGDDAVCDIYYYDNKISGIKVVSPQFKTENGLTCNSTVTDLFDKGGKVKVDEGNYLYLCIVCDELSFDVVEDLTQKGYDKMVRACGGENLTFSAADFKANAKAKAITINNWQ